jgi:hypothetical protein
MSTAKAIGHDNAVDGKLRQIIVLLDELIVVIGEENWSLSAGVPASLSQSVGRKTQLAERLESWCDAMRRGEIDMRLSEPALLAILIERLRTLRAAMDKNTSLIRHAMLATRRRINAIMQALRETQRVSSGYGSDTLVKRRAADSRGTQWA